MTAFAWNNPYPWPRKPLLAANVVATSQPLAAQAGLQMLAGGGSAVDAILATAITLTLEPRALCSQDALAGIVRSSLRAFAPMMNSTARRSGAAPANQRGRSLTAGYGC